MRISGYPSWTRNVLDTLIFDLRNRGHLHRYDGSPLEITYRYKSQKMPSDTKDTFEMLLEDEESHEYIMEHHRLGLVSVTGNEGCDFKLI